MHRRVMATALHGTKSKGKVKSPGICALLGLKPFTPHDLRRTAATLAGDLGFGDVWIANCLGHAASKKRDQVVPSVTGKVHSKRTNEKRAVLDGVAAELRQIVGEPVRADAASDLKKDNDSNTRKQRSEANSDRREFRAPTLILALDQHLDFVQVQYRLALIDNVIHETNGGRQ